VSTQPEETPWSLHSLDLPPLEPLESSWEPLDLPPVEPVDLDAVRRERYTQPRTWKGTGKGATPPKLNDPRMVHLLSVLETGATLRTACRVSGLAERSVYRWLAQGEEHETRGEEGSPVWHIWQAVTLAKLVPEVTALQVIHDASQKRGGWRAAAWFLERRYPERWGKNAKPEEPPAVTVEEVDAKILRLLAEYEEQEAAE
jgi:hypothetical protein